MIEYVSAESDVFANLIVISIAIAGLSQYLNTQARGGIKEHLLVHDETQKWLKGVDVEDVTKTYDEAKEIIQEKKKNRKTDVQGLLTTIKDGSVRIGKANNLAYYAIFFVLSIPFVHYIIIQFSNSAYIDFASTLSEDTKHYIDGGYYAVGLVVNAWALITGLRSVSAVSSAQKAAAELLKLREINKKMNPGDNEGVGAAEAGRTGGSSFDGDDGPGGGGVPSPVSNPGGGNGGGAGTTILTGAPLGQTQNQASAVQGTADDSQSSGGLNEEQVIDIIRKHNENARDDDETQQARREGREELKKKVDQGKVDQAEQIAIEFDEAQARQNIEELRWLEERAEAQRRKEHKRDIRRKIEAYDKKERLRDTGSDAGSGGKSNNKNRPGYAAHAAVQHARSMERAARIAKEDSQIKTRIAQTSEMLSAVERARKSKRSLGDVVRELTEQGPGDKNRKNPK